VVKILYDDLELINNILDGDMDSFSTLICKYELSIFNFIYGMIKDADASRDLTQEVFIIVYNKLYTYICNLLFHNGPFLNIYHWYFALPR
jgi:RNA polymerase sigma-70 factor (ECF subfamily)